MTAAEFVAKWRAVTAGERAVAQSHFIDLCDLLDVPNPVEEDPAGAEYAFERHVKKAAKGKGFADAWKRGHFAWEYKGKGKDLGAAYMQLLLYRDDLENPPLLIVSDIERIEIHTNFTGTNKAIYTYTLDDLRNATKRTELRRAWTDPASFDPRRRREHITEDATREIGRIALSLRDRGHDPQRVAHFMMQLVFTLFAEDTRLLPNKLLTKILERAQNPERVQEYLASLFQAMSTGGEVLLEDVPHFNGGLFDGTDALPLNSEEIAILHRAALLDWAEVEPAIFGTLFERSLDPEKRSQLGAHYTSRDDIQRIVEPVIIQPLRQRWHEIREAAEAFLADPPSDPKKAAKKRQQLVDAPISQFLHDLHQVRVLDPACGSGNFLYVALQAMKDLEHEVVTFAEQVGAPGLRLLGPRQFYGIEVNPFAHELASMVVWIGYLQWNRANGITSRQTPILESLENIRLHDALLNSDGSEYEWPEAEFIVGNPPFIGGKRMRAELSDAYVDRVFYAFDGRVPREADFVTYWFEKARAQISTRRSKRAGLIATNSIRAGANRRVLQRVKESGDIFFAWPDEPWVLDGAAVRVSLIGIDDGSTKPAVLNGRPVESIHANLTSGLDLTSAQPLSENVGRSFMGTTKVGPFEVDEATAKLWLGLPNSSGKPNGDVVRPWVNASHLMGQPKNLWIVDFGLRTLEEARAYEAPFEYVAERVRPLRQQNNRAQYRERWWQHAEPRPALRAAIEDRDSVILTPRVAKHRVFFRVESQVVPDSRLFVIILEDALFGFGVLQSLTHETWSLAQASRHGDGDDGGRPTYNSTTCFETFPFPSASPEQREQIAACAKHLEAVREYLLASDAKLTVTKLYNEVDLLRDQRNAAARAFSLLLAHERLDEAVAAAYGWEWPLSDDEILERLLALNLERAAEESAPADLDMTASK